jgi:hypothetical protein
LRKCWCTAASFAVIGAVACYYGPRLWQRIADHAPPQEPAWRQYLDGWRQEVGVWQDEIDGLTGWHPPRR